MTNAALPTLRPRHRAALFIGAAVVLWFVFDRLDASLSAAVDVAGSASVTRLAIGAILAMGAMVAIGVGWVPFLHQAGSSTSTLTVVVWYFVGEITKYVPGGIWAVVGRGELAAREIGRRPAYRSVTESLLVLFATAGWPASIAVRDYNSWPAPVRLLGAIALLALLPVVGRMLRLPLAVLTAAVARYLLAWLTIGLVTVAVASALGLSIGVADAVAATSAAWLAGFVIVFVPGGVGVREAVFVALTSTELSPSGSLAVALVARLLFVFADTVGAIVGLGVGRSSAGTGVSR